MKPYRLHLLRGQPFALVLEHVPGAQRVSCTALLNGEKTEREARMGLPFFSWPGARGQPRANSVCDGTPIEDKAERVTGHAIDQHFVVQMRPDGQAGFSDFADHRAPAHGLTVTYECA